MERLQELPERLLECSPAHALPAHDLDESIESTERETRERRECDGDDRASERGVSGPAGRVDGDRHLGDDRAAGSGPRSRPPSPLSEAGLRTAGGVPAALSGSSARCSGPRGRADGALFRMRWSRSPPEWCCSLPPRCLSSDFLSDSDDGDGTGAAAGPAATGTVRPAGRSSGRSHMPKCRECHGDVTPPAVRCRRCELGAAGAPSSCPVLSAPCSARVTLLLRCEPVVGNLCPVVYRSPVPHTAFRFPSLPSVNDSP